MGLVETLADNHSTSSNETKEPAKEFGASALYGLKLDSKLNSRINFDYTRGLLHQIFEADMSFKEYVTYINEPKHLINPVRDIRLFDNWFLEMCSKSPWWGILLAYIPLELWTVAKIQEHALYTSPLALLVQIVAGIWLWTFIEYIFHRFLFHGEDHWMYYTPHNKWWFTGHFMIHGIHHAFPQDRLRLVFPPVPGYFLFCNLIYLPMRSVLPIGVLHPIWLGVIIGYLLYDQIHFWLHHASPQSGYWKDLKLYHMQHHYKFGTIGFGVSQKFWDIVFNTEIKGYDKSKAN